jgi:peroxiredoxin
VLASTSGSDVTLSALRGSESVLLAFFPLAFTGVCTAEMCAFSEDYDQFAASGVRVLPISVDSVPTLKEFRAKHDISVDLLSDFHREASRAYGVLIPERFFSNRAYFLIDRDGIIRWSHVEATPGSRRENSEILERIAELG